MKLLCLIFLLFCSLALQAQSSPLPLTPIQVSFSYFGEYLTHTGIRIGMQTPLRWNVIPTASGKEIAKGWIVGGYLTVYTHQRNHRGWLLTGFIGRERIGKHGLMTQYGLEAGYMASFLQGEVWTREEGAATFTEGQRASSHVVFGINGGIGWDFSKQTKLPIRLSLHPHGYLQAPYNSIMVPRLAVESRLSYAIR